MIYVVSNDQKKLLDEKVNNEKNDTLATYLTERYVAGKVGGKGDKVFTDNKEIVGEGATYKPLTIDKK